MPQFRETRFGPVEAFEEKRNVLPKWRKRWMAIKNSRLFNFIKHSPLNPYHFGIKKIVADTPQQEQEIAREKGLPQYIDKNGVRCLVNFDGTPQEEYEKTGKVLRKNMDVANLIPRDKNGKLDLMAEEPIVMSIIPMEGVSITGHVSMQYQDRVINRVLTMEMDPVYPRYQHASEYYFIYPSKVGIKPEELIRELDKHNIRHGKDPYNMLNNNCAKNVADILKKVGIEDIDFLGPDKLGLTFATPGNNPFKFGIKDWCMRHGVPARLEEIALLYKHHEIPGLEDRKKEFDNIRQRHNHFKNYILRKKTASKLSEMRNKAAKTVDAAFNANLRKRKIPAFLKFVEKKISDTVFGRGRE